MEFTPSAKSNLKGQPIHRLLAVELDILISKVKTWAQK